jgi:SAM-dependent methyltransferase
MQLWLIGLIIFGLAFAIAGRMGAPYVPILKRDSDALFKLAELKPGQTIIDLGCGDGRMLRTAASQGIHGIGYEINPFMVIVAKIVCWRYRKLVTIHLANLWRTDLPPADAIYVFLMPQFMERLDHRLQEQIHQPTKVVSFAFAIPGRPTSAHNKNTFVYEYTGTAN